MSDSTKPKNIDHLLNDRPDFFPQPWVLEKHDGIMVYTAFFIVPPGREREVHLVTDAMRREAARVLREMWMRHN